jgi:uncharacterized protein (DUF2237 family)
VAERFDTAGFLNMQTSGCHQNLAWYAGALQSPGRQFVAKILIDEPLNVFGEPLLPCSEDPLTGFLRDGCCNTNDQDVGSHTVCVLVTEAFLQYSRFAGNDLSTPMPEYGFPGLKPGDRWCLCAPRWLQAHEQDMAPKVFLTRTHLRALDTVPLDVLRKYAADLN